MEEILRIARTAVMLRFPFFFPILRLLHVSDNMGGGNHVWKGAGFPGQHEADKKVTWLFSRVSASIGSGSGPSEVNR